MDSNRFNTQLAFLAEIDGLKQVLRRTRLLSEQRRENDAEHSWHLAMYVMVLQEYAAGAVDLSRCLQMVLIHDIVEIDAGDTFCYDEAGRETQAEREQKAADRLFALLPAPQDALIRGLWDEFEALQTPEARFARAMDRLQPLVHNYRTQGSSWREHGVTADQVLQHNQAVAAGAPQLWPWIEAMVADAVRQGFLAAGPAAASSATGPRVAPRPTTPSAPGAPPALPRTNH